MVKARKVGNDKKMNRLFNSADNKEGNKPNKKEEFERTKERTGKSRMESAKDFRKEREREDVIQPRIKSNRKPSTPYNGRHSTTLPYSIKLVFDRVYSLIHPKDKDYFQNDSHYRVDSFLLLIKWGKVRYSRQFAASGRSHGSTTSLVAPNLDRFPTAEAIVRDWDYLNDLWGAIWGGDYTEYLRSGVWNIDKIVFARLPYVDIIADDAKFYNENDAMGERLAGEFRGRFKLFYNSKLDSFKYHYRSPRTTQINGNNGSATNTDDHDDEPFSILATGTQLRGVMEKVRKISRWMKLTYDNPLLANLFDWVYGMDDVFDELYVETLSTQAFIDLVTNHGCVAFLNGNNGSWTGMDDVGPEDNKIKAQVNFQNRRGARQRQRNTGQGGKSKVKKPPQPRQDTKGEVESETSKFIRIWKEHIGALKDNPQWQELGVANIEQGALRSLNLKYGITATKFQAAWRGHIIRKKKVIDKIREKKTLDMYRQRFASKKMREMKLRNRAATKIQARFRCFYCFKVNNIVSKKREKLVEVSIRRHGRRVFRSANIILRMIRVYVNRRRLLKRLKQLVNNKLVGLAIEQQLKKKQRRKTHFALRRFLFNLKDEVDYAKEYYECGFAYKGRCYPHPEDFNDFNHFVRVLVRLSKPPLKNHMVRLYRKVPTNEFRGDGVTLSRSFKQQIAVEGVLMPLRTHYGNVAKYLYDYLTWGNCKFPSYPLATEKQDTLIKHFEYNCVEEYLFCEDMLKLSEGFKHKFRGAQISENLHSAMHSFHASHRDGHLSTVPPDWHSMQSNAADFPPSKVRLVIKYTIQQLAFEHVEDATLQVYRAVEPIHYY